MKTEWKRLHSTIGIVHLTIATIYTRILWEISVLLLNWTSEFSVYRLIALSDEDLLLSSVMNVCLCYIFAQYYFDIGYNVMRSAGVNFKFIALCFH